MQRRLLLNCAEILEAREARLKELQASDDLAAPPAPASPSQKPWTRSVEAPTPYFRGIADARQRQEILAEFSGGRQLGADLLDYFTCCRWEEAQEGKAKGGTWLELAADFEVAVGTNLRPPLYRRQGQRPLTRIERNKSAEQKAYLMHRYVKELEGPLESRCSGHMLRPGSSVRRVASFRDLGVRWTAGLS